MCSMVRYCHKQFERQVNRGIVLDFIWSNIVSNQNPARLFSLTGSIYYNGGNRHLETGPASFLTRKPRDESE